MCVRHKLRKEDSALTKSLFINPKVFVLVIRYPYLLNTILKYYTKLLNVNVDEKVSKKEFDNCLFEVESDNESISLKGLKVLKFTEPKERFIFNPTLHVMEQIFERNLKYFDWSILCNIYKEVINKEHIKSFKYEITNTRCTVNYAVNDNVISLITAWTGHR